MQKKIKMTTKLNLVLLLLLTVLISCKNDKSEINQVQQVEVNKSFNVLMNMIVKEDDNFQIYYNEDGSDVFEGENYVSVDVKGKEEPQEIVFKLPEEALPASLRFDMGSNKNQKEVKIIDFKMKYFEKSFEAKDTLFVYYFGNNNQIDYIRDKAIAIPKPIASETYDPIFTGTEMLKQEIDKLIK